MLGVLAVAARAGIMPKVLLWLLLLGSVSAAAFRKGCVSDGECQDGFVCGAGGQCGSAEREATEEYPVWLAAVYALIAGAVGCALAILGTVGRYPSGEIEEEQAFVNSCFTVSVGLFLIIVLGGSTGIVVGMAAPRSLGPLPDLGNGSYCRTTQDSVCGKFGCDLRNNKCLQTCLEDHHCGEGMECLDATCQRPTRQPLVAPGAAVAIGASFGAFCCVLVISPAFGILADSRRKEKIFGSFCCTLFCFLVFAAVFGPTIGFSTKGVPKKSGQQISNITCTLHSECFPYYCHFENNEDDTGLCYDECRYSTHCHKGWRCEDESVCQIKQKSVYTAKVHTVGTTMLISFAVAFCCGSTLMAGSVGYFYLGSDSSDEEIAPMLGTCSVFCTCFLIFVVGMSAGLIMHRGGNVAAPEDAAPCWNLDADVCLPYRCNLDVQQCLGSCENDAHCQKYHKCDKSSNVCKAVNGVKPIMPARDAVLWSTGTALVAAALPIMAALCYWRRLRRLLILLQKLLNLTWMSFYLFTVCLFLLVFILSREDGHSRDTSLTVDTSDGAPACAGVQAVACKPYFCNPDKQRCYSACGETADCRDGFVCSDGTCVDAPIAYSQKHKYFNLKVGLCACALIGIVFVCYNSPCAPGLRVRPEEWQILWPCWVLTAGIAFIVFPGLTIIVAEMRSGHVVDITVVADPTTWSNATACTRAVTAHCLPYFCDIKSNFCLTTCNKNDECDATHVCDDNNQCVEDKEGPAYFGILFTVLGVVWMYALGAPFVTHIRLKRREAARRKRREKMAAEQAALEKFENEIKAIDKVPGFSMQPARTPDPSDPPGYDISMLTPNPVAEGEFPPATATANPNATDRECAICYTDDAEIRLLGRQCPHGFCAECVQSELSTILESDKFPAKCPACAAGLIAGEEPPSGQNALIGSNVASEVIEHLLHRSILTLDFARRFIKQQVLKAFGQHQAVECPACNLLQAQPDYAAKDINGPDRYRVHCQECPAEFCGKCLEFWFHHDKMDCETVSKRKAGGLDKKTRMLIYKTAKQCPGCDIQITHYKGHHCHHISPGSGCTNCGTHFCYVCLEIYQGGSARCTCDLFCTRNCGCPPCPDCKSGGRRCDFCGDDGEEGCPTCRRPRGHTDSDDDSDDSEDLNEFGGRSRRARGGGVGHIIVGRPIRPRPDDYDQLIINFSDMTGTDPRTSHNYLAMFNYDVVQAAEYFLNGNAAVQQEEDPYETPGGVNSINVDRRMRRRSLRVSFSSEDPDVRVDLRETPSSRTGVDDFPPRRFEMASPTLRTNFEMNNPVPTTRDEEDAQIQAAMAASLAEALEREAAASSVSLEAAHDVELPPPKEAFSRRLSEPTLRSTPEDTPSTSGITQLSNSDDSIRAPLDKGKAEM